MPGSENPARGDAKTLKLAAMDFALIPMEQVRKELGVDSKAIYHRRQSALYKETVEELKKAWTERLLATPATKDLRRKINYGLSIAIHKLVEILACDKTQAKDIINAARLMAQMDGRFLGSEQGDGVHAPNDTDSVAQELIQAIKRTKETVQ